jgi:hypothetical protein
MEEEDVKGGDPFIKLRPQVHSMKACIVSMEYKIKNADNTPKLNLLAQSYADADKVTDLFCDTLKWHKKDVIRF